LIAHIALLPMAAGFATGTTTHTLQLIDGGLLPYRSVPLRLFTESVYCEEWRCAGRAARRRCSDDN